MTRSLIALALTALALSAQAGALKVTVLDKEGKPVPDAVVVLVPASAGAPKPLPTKVTITQEKMRFVPAVSLVAVGAQATFINNDPWEHHVRASAAGIQNFDSAATGGFELRLDGKAPGKAAQQVDAKFDKAGPVLLGCHLHASMKAHVFVSDTPWATVSDADGYASFDNVPEGAVRMRVWHADQLFDLPVQQVTLTSAPANATMQLQVVPRRRRV
jgi:plastocyanin